MLIENKVEKLVKKVKTFIISCVDENGYPLTKAVSPSKYRNQINEMYFCTNTSSKFAHAIGKNNKAAVYFYSRKIVWEGCMLKGHMEIIKDLAVKKLFWQEKYKDAYAQKSYADPDFCVLKFVPVSGRYYVGFKPIDFAINQGPIAPNRKRKSMANA